MKQGGPGGPPRRGPSSNRGAGNRGSSHRASSGHRGRPFQGRRPPPGEGTGAEAAFLQKSKETGTAMVVRLVDGEQIHGVIEYYDRHMIKINRERGPNLFIRKDQILYMHEDEDA